MTFSSFSVRDKAAAKSFYVDVLGLKMKDNEIGFLELYTDGNSPIMVYEKENHVPATFTILNFMTDNIELLVESLSNKGIKFDQYDEPMKTNEQGIHVSDKGAKIAWFKDPSDNHIAIIQQ